MRFGGEEMDEVLYFTSKHVILITSRCYVPPSLAVVSTAFHVAD